MAILDNNMLLISIHGRNNPTIIWSAVKNTGVSVDSGTETQTIIDFGNANSLSAIIPVGDIKNSSFVFSNSIESSV